VTNPSQRAALDAHIHRLSEDLGLEFATLLEELARYAVDHDADELANNLFGRALADCACVINDYRKIAIA
jgi:hypothetical protein